MKNITSSFTLYSNICKIPIAKDFCSDHSLENTSKTFLFEHTSTRLISSAKVEVIGFSFGLLQSVSLSEERIRPEIVVGTNTKRIS